MLSLSHAFVIKRHKEGGYDLFQSHSAVTRNIRVAIFGTNLNHAQVFTDRRQAVKIVNMAGRGELSAVTAGDTTWGPGAPIDGLEIVPCTLTRAISERS